MEIKNAIIKSADIIINNGCLDARLQLDYGSSCQEFGGWSLYLPRSYTYHETKSVAGHFIFRVLEIAGVLRWDALIGKTIRVKADYSKISEIGHIVNNDWFNPDIEFINSINGVRDD